MTTAYLGIDIGLSGVRAAVMSARGHLLGKSSRDARTGAVSPARLLGYVNEAARAALDGAGLNKIEAMALAAIGPVPVLLDGKGAIVAHLPLFSQAAIDDAVCQPDDDLAARLLDFGRRNRAASRQVRTVCDLTGYLVSRLTGCLAIDQVTAEDYARLTLPGRARLPGVRDGAAVVGGLSRMAANRLGLPAGTPVAAGTYDSTADLLAAGFGPGRRSVIVLGSTIVIGTLTGTPLADPHLRSTPHLGKGWFSGGWTSASGTSLNFAQRVLARPSKAPAGPVPLVWPYLAGERAPVWCAEATGMVAGLSPETNAAALHQGFIEGVALSAADIAERLEAEAGQIRHWTVTGGASRSEVLMGELASALGATLSTVRGAADHLGPALLAARSTGLDIRLPVVKRHKPSARRTALYREKLGIYRQVFEAVRPLLGGINRVTLMRSS